MKDFDSLQNITPENVRGMLPAVPKELVEAFGHDPAGVTGPTRRLQGWRAVEDIHHRVHRQQHTFKSFLDTFDEQPLSGQCALDKPIEILEILLDELENEKAEITANAESVSQLLKATQEVHAKLKDIYNKMVSHVSVVYPQVFPRYYHPSQNLLTTSLVITYRCFGGELQGPVSTILGAGHGRTHPTSGHRYAFLANVREDDW